MPADEAAVRVCRTRNRPGIGISTPAAPAAMQFPRPANDAHPGFRWGMRQMDVGAGRAARLRGAMPLF